MLKTMLKEQTCLFEKAETFQILFLRRHQEPKTQTLFLKFFSFYEYVPYCFVSLLLEHTWWERQLQELVVHCDLEGHEQGSSAKFS